MTVRRLAGLVLAVVMWVATPHTVAAPVPKAKQPPSLDGLWQLVEFRVGDDVLPLRRSQVWEVDGEQLTISTRQKDGTLRPTDPDMTATLVRPDRDRPERIDYRRRWNGGSDDVQPALAEVDGDTLTLCYGYSTTQRPTELKPADGVTLLRFKRIKSE